MRHKKEEENDWVQLLFDQLHTNILLLGKLLNTGCDDYDDFDSTVLKFEYI